MSNPIIPPEYVTVGPYRISVVVVDELWDEEDGALCGSFDHQKGIISLDSSLLEEPVQFIAALLHEMKHAYLWYYGKIHRRDVIKMTEEDLVVNFETTLMSMLWENTGLFHQITLWTQAEKGKRNV